MIKKLQKRFITIALLSVVIVFLVIMIVINTVNYANVRHLSDEILETLSLNEGVFAEFPKPDGGSKWDPHITGETPFETRYFFVTYDNDGNIIEVFTKNIRMVNDQDAINFANDVYNNTKNGYLNFFRYSISQKENQKMIIFVDCTKQLQTANNFLKTSVIVSLSAIIAIAILVIFLSRRAINPIARSYEKQKKFITDASHELKTPLTVISANTELLEMENGESDYIKTIQKQIKLLTQMTKNLVILSKIDEDEILRDKCDFNLSDTIVEMTDSFKKVLEKNKKELRKNISNDIIFNGNELLIRQLFSILFDNACKYSVSYVTVSLTKVKNEVVFTIENDTTGIEKGDLIKYCDRFYRTDSSRASAIDGSGIGLSIAKEICDIHKLNLKLFSEDGIKYTVSISK